ncbi:MAG: hypothetical protein KGR47_09215, partial [Acidobacteria bacterium]|nr:hypothetical protein [Acidobacteriota bacterium]
ALALGNGATGGVAVFMYAFAFYVLPHALVAVPLATTLAPRVADRWQERDATTARNIIDSSMRFAVPLLLLGGAGMVGLAWPVTRVAAVGQTASQGFAPIAHTLAAFGPGLLGYGIAFVMTRVLFAIGDVRRASMLMIFAAVAGVATMAVTSTLMAPTERAAALAIGYGASQTVAAVLLTGRVRTILGAPRWGALARVLGTSLVAAAVAVGVMLAVVGRFGTSRPTSLLALLVAGAAGVAAFAAVLSAGGGRQFLRVDGR